MILQSPVRKQCRSGFARPLAMIVFCVAAAAQTSPPWRPGPPPAPAEVSADFTTGYAKGLEQNRFILVFFRDNSKFTTQENAEFEKLRSDRTLAPILTFVKSDLPGDKMGMQAAQGLHVKAMPAISVFAPHTNNLFEVTRFEGVYTYAELHDGIIADFCKNLKDGKITVSSSTATALGCPAR